MVTALLAVTLTGCGSGSPAAGTSSGSKRTQVDEQQKDKELKYVQCLRKHGMKIGDPVDGKYEIDNSDSKDPKAQAALKACAQYAPNQTEDKISAKDLDNRVKMAQCMRRHGINVKDPTGNNSIAQQVPAGTSPEELEKVSQACRKELGIKGRG
jgi:hypothetical protein